MNDYSKYVNIPEDFILSYEVENDGITIKTKENPKGDKDKPPVTKNNIKECENKLKDQYITLIQKQEKILQENIDKRIKIVSLLAIVLTVICILTSEFSDLLGMIFCGMAVSTTIIGSICTVLYQKIFKSEITTYKKFLTERKEIEQTNQIDKSITQNLSKPTREILRTNHKLKNEGLIDQVFNINFMDKASLIDLKKILERYCISRTTKSINDSKNENNYQGRAKKRTPFIRRNGR